MSRRHIWLDADALATGICEILNDTQRRPRLKQDAAGCLAIHGWPQLSIRLSGLIGALAQPPLQRGA